METRGIISQLIDSTLPPDTNKTAPFFLIHTNTSMIFFFFMSISGQFMKITDKMILIIY